MWHIFQALLKYEVHIFKCFCIITLRSLIVLYYSSMPNAYLDSAIWYVWQTNVSKMHPSNEVTVVALHSTLRTFGNLMSLDCTSTTSSFVVNSTSSSSCCCQSWGPNERRCSTEIIPARCFPKVSQGSDMGEVTWGRVRWRYLIRWIPPGFASWSWQVTSYIKG